MRIAVLRERGEHECRVALVPEVVRRLISLGAEVTVEAGAGAPAHFADDEYRQAGATVAPDVPQAIEAADLLVAVGPPPEAFVEGLRPQAALVAMFQPHDHIALVERCRTGRVTAFSLELVPRISRAQSMDALSSQATVSGYRAVLVAADRLPKFFPLLMTAAGTIPPAKVLVLGAGVAGLQAIATARRLGALVRANDIRASSREEVESLGATFVELELEAQGGSGGYAREVSEDFLSRQRALIASEVRMADAVITTASVPGRRAPVLVTGDMVTEMSPGSVIVDLAAETGGNCELSIAGEDVVTRGVTIVGAQNLPSQMPTHASFLYARNVAEFARLLAPTGELALDFDDEIVTASCITHDGHVRHEPTRALLEEETT